jgi:hypothetical protein
MIGNVKSIEDFIAFKYQHEEAYEQYIKEENRVSPYILIPIKGVLTQVKLIDAIVQETPVPENPEHTVFDMEAIIKLPIAIQFTDKSGAMEITDIIHVKNSCISPSGCTKLDWSNVSCPWEPEIN